MSWQCKSLHLHEFACPPPPSFAPLARPPPPSFAPLCPPPPSFTPLCLPSLPLPPTPGRALRLHSHSQQPCTPYASAKHAPPNGFTRTQSPQVFLQPLTSEASYTPVTG
eukprot:TRINITY_DN265_c0_g1_i4.p1 TRINITY_DN265_c0_g1~~TRINITY_DN265_c0_g1_i4.p1  ORF type:complete len:109 (-),score=7.58 TRINITY_DN265_c0_g1_i4:1122-1448(-)